MLPALAVGPSLRAQSQLPVETRQDPPAAGAPLEEWDQWTAARTFEAVVNQPWRKTCAKPYQPASLQSLAAEAASQDLNGGPIRTFAEARNVSIAKQVWANGSVWESSPYMGLAPRLLARHLMGSGEVFDDELVSAFAQLPSVQQNELLVSLEPVTPSGSNRCRQLAAQLRGSERRFWTLVPSCDRGADVDEWRTFFTRMSPPEQLAWARTAMRAGRQSYLISNVLGLSKTHPDSWHLEQVAAHGPVVGRSIEAGMSFDDIYEMFGVLDVPSAMAHMELLFCTTWGDAQVRSGRGCEEVLRQWGKRTIFDTPTDLRLVVFRDEPEALRAYEVQHGLAPEPHRSDFGRQWICANREAVQAANAGGVIGQLLEQYQLDAGKFRHRLEMASCFGVAGREVFEGKSGATQAMAHYGLTDKTARYWLDRIEREGRPWRGAPIAFRRP